MLLPLSVLSYASIIGIFSLLAIIGIILFDGFAKPDSPGSLWSPAETSLGIDNYRELGIAFGLFMAGVCFPTLLALRDTHQLFCTTVRRPRYHSDAG